VRALPSDIAERFGIKTVDLDPKYIEVGDDAQDLEVALGFRVEVKVEQNVDIRPRAVPDRFKMRAKVSQYLAVFLRDT